MQQTIKCLNISLALFFLFSFLFSSSGHAASLSGDVFQSDRFTPLAEDVLITVYKGIPCCTAQYVDSVLITPADGPYIINSLEAGTYYIKAEVTADSNYFSEWYAAPSSAPHCNDSMPVILPLAGSRIRHLDFQLDTGATISGHVYQADGTTPIDYNAYNSVSVYPGDPCDNYTRGSSAVGTIAPNGSYTAQGLRAGTYYLQTAIDSDVNFIDEWWAGLTSAEDCSQAQTITVTEGQAVSGKNFQLSGGAGISGSVYGSDGTTLATSRVTVEVYRENPCGNDSGIKRVYQYSGDLGYKVVGLKSGTYYLRAYPSSSDGNYLEEWWAGSNSTQDCRQARSITVVAETNSTAKHFHLNSGATISGDLYQSDGITPATGYLSVRAYTGDPCGEKEPAASYSGWSHNPYTLVGLKTGVYYLQASSDDNFIEAWWAGSTSSGDCSQAKALTITEGQNLTGKDFQLESGGVISGTVYQSDGVTPITTGVYLDIVRGDPCNAPEFFKDDDSASDGQYTANGLPTGTYYITAKGSRDGNFITEWWAGLTSAGSCSQAQPINVVAGNYYLGNDFQLDQGAVICGTLYHSDDITPITGEDLNVQAYNTDPCTTLQDNNSIWGPVDSETGTFHISALPGNNYSVQAFSGQRANYIAEWWHSSASVRNCNQAQQIPAVEGTTYTGKNFQLEPGATVSGTLFGRDGTTIIHYSNEVEFLVEAYSGDPCDTTNNPVSTGGDIEYSTDKGSSYTISGLPPGSYYILAKNNPYSWSHKKIYKDEWWATPFSMVSCSRAQAITVTGLENIIGRNFQLDPFEVLFPWTMFMPAIIGHEQQQ